MGKLLNIPNGELDIIEYDHSESVTKCCNEMLTKWLDIDVTASWQKLLIAINLHTVTCSGQTSTNKCE